VNCNLRIADKIEEIGHIDDNIASNEYSDENAELLEFELFRIHATFSISRPRTFLKLYKHRSKLFGLHNYVAVYSQSA